MGRKADRNTEVSFTGAIGDALESRALVVVQQAAEPRMPMDPPALSRRIPIDLTIALRWRNRSCGASSTALPIAVKATDKLPKSALSCFRGIGRND